MSFSALPASEWQTEHINRWTMFIFKSPNSHAWKRCFCKWFIDESATLRLTECAASLPLTAQSRHRERRHCAESQTSRSQRRHRERRHCAESQTSRSQRRHRERRHCAESQTSRSQPGAVLARSYKWMKAKVFFLKLLGLSVCTCYGEKQSSQRGLKVAKYSAKFPLDTREWMAEGGWYWGSSP